MRSSEERADSRNTHLAEEKNASLLYDFCLSIPELVHRETGISDLSFPVCEAFFTTSGRKQR